MNKKLNKLKNGIKVFLRIYFHYISIKTFKYLLKIMSIMILMEKKVNMIYLFMGNMMIINYNLKITLKERIMNHLKMRL